MPPLPQFGSFFDDSPSYSTDHLSKETIRLFHHIGIWKFVNRKIPTNYKFINYIIIDNDIYKPIINKIITIQQHIRRHLLRKKINNLCKNRHIIELYYHPDNKGGYFAKKRLSNYLEKN